MKATLKTGDETPTTKAHFAITLDQPGTVWLGMVSLFPPTWNNQPNGFRKDLMQMMVDLHPKFLRFPGGNYIEGDTVETRFEWKKTIGPIEERHGHQGPWGYRSTDGLGLLEFLEWCEDMKAEPVLAVYAGYSLKGMHVNPGPDLAPFVQDALDEIEYVTGDANTQWGARAGQGRPSRAVQAALRRNRQRRLVRQIGQLRRPVRAILRRHQGEVSAAQTDFHHRQRPAGNKLASTAASPT